MFFSLFNGIEEDDQKLSLRTFADSCCELSHVQRPALILSGFSFISY